MRARAVQDYDEAQFDALYICLALEEGPLEKLCDWLVELSIHLIRPAALQPDEAAAGADGGGPCCRLLPGERFQYFANRVAQARPRSQNVPSLSRSCICF